MKITKFGHCCLLIEEAGLRLLTDPGIFTVAAHSVVQNLNAIIITHEHADHFHLESLKEILKLNPQVKIYTNKSVGALLQKEGINFMRVEDGEIAMMGELKLEGFGSKHEEIYQDYGQVENTSYFIGPRLFYPGDAFYAPNREVEILALPVVGPWMKISQAIEYAKKIRPKVAFPVHDGILKNPALVHTPAEKYLKENGIDFKPLLENGILEI
ncbi:MAG: MBL fold metallo-hydrolase [Candidatus Doudnabacteria bacterium]|nr:MBL fold metallo-hydrolase [Candidatus Doudnabacteria bacterium]